MRTIDKRMKALENRIGPRSIPVIHRIMGYVFDIEEDRKPIIQEYCEIDGIDRKDGRDHRFTCFIRPQHETDKRIAEGRERTPPDWREAS